MNEIYSPGVLSVLPLFYVGWSDSVLGPSERDLIISSLESMPHLSFEDKKLLAGWTDQANPPTEETFRSWIKAIKEKSTDWSPEMKSELVDLGISMAEKSSTKKNDKLYSSKKVVDSILLLEETLGITDYNQSNSLFAVLKKYNSNSSESLINKTLSDRIAVLLDGDYAALKYTVKQLLKDSFFQNVDQRDKEKYRNRVLAQCKEFAKQGFSRFPFPKEYGGENDPGSTTVVFEAAAHGDLSLLIKFGVQFGLFGGAIHMLGTEKHHKKYIPGLMKLDIAGCFAMTETGHGSNVRELQTTATYDKASDSFIIHSPEPTAGKEYIGNALHSTLAVVFAQLIVGDKKFGVHAFIVPLRNEDHKLFPGIRVEDNGYKMGLNGVDNGRIWFSHVSIPRDNLLNKYGDVGSNGQYTSTIKSDSRRFFTMLGALVQGRVCIALASNTATKNALSIAIRYALKRRQFSQVKEGPEVLILDYPSHQQRLFPKLAITYALHFGLEELRKMFIAQTGTGDMRKVESLAAGLKAIASWHARDTIQECREACGGKGYLNENAFADLKADTDIFTTFEGDNQVLLQLVAKGLLTEFKEEFQDGGYMAVLRHLGSRLSTSISEANPITIRNTNADHLLDSEFHLAALEYRENNLLFSLSTRMRSFIKKRLSPNDTYNRVQNHMVILAKASIDIFCAKQFYLRISDIEDIELKKHMSNLANLYSLQSIYDNRGWYLENDYISGPKSKAIRKQIEFLCKRIRPNAATYIDAFQIPDELLRAEII